MIFKTLEIRCCSKSELVRGLVGVAKAQTLCQTAREFVNANAKYNTHSLADSKSLLSSLLLGQSHLLVVSSSLDVLSLLGSDELDMAV